jgi:hypothetical protein
MSPTEQICRGLTIREFAEINGMSEYSVRRAVNHGKIPSYKVSGSRRIPSAYLEDLQRCGDDTETEIAKTAATLAALWPDLTDEQLDRIAVLLRGVGSRAPSADAAKAAKTQMPQQGDKLAVPLLVDEPEPKPIRRRSNARSTSAVR